MSNQDNHHDDTSADKDEEEFLRVMKSLNQPTDDLGLGDIWSRELETGDKADDAVDYEDIDDDDLPDEEEVDAGDQGRAVKIEDEDEEMEMEMTVENGVGLGLGLDMDCGMSGVTTDAPPGESGVGVGGGSDVDSLFGGDEVDDHQTGAIKDVGEDTLDDLFGDRDDILPDRTVPSTVSVVPRTESSERPEIGQTVVSIRPASTEGAESFNAVKAREKAVETREHDEQGVEVHEAQQKDQSEDMDPVTFKEWQLQQALFAMSSYGVEPPAPPENHEELLASLWPKFRKDEQPRFLELLPPKKSYFIGKQPLRTPKKLLPTKLHLEIAQDQERLFKTGAGAKRGMDFGGMDNPSLVVVKPEIVEEENQEGDFGGLINLEDDMDEELPGNVTMCDLQVMCADWDDTVTPPTPPADKVERMKSELTGDDVKIVDTDDWLLEENPNKKRKTGKNVSDFVAFRHLDIPYFDDPFEATEKLARTINLDLNDPYLLLDEFPDESALRSARKEYNRTPGGGLLEGGNLAKKLIKRYNISNDEAYDMLKENHQNRVRSTLGNVAIEHSLPAIRLQWPYYKTKLARQEARSFHRPALSFFPNLPVAFRKPGFIKRKHQRGKDVKVLYDSTKSLSLADNSHVMLVEYSEEYPLMLSNFGMGSRLVNYYRRKNMEDTSRPKADLGETAVLLPQDKSPFSIFGHVDPGETTTAVVTSMYRAPVWHHATKPTDFLIIRNSTGIEGTHYYLRIIENLFVAGQQFPSVDVPGPHSRKVTTASKNRLKMISYRKIKKSKSHRVSVADITEHFPDSNDMQNRQKMKEFLQFNKDYKEWEMKPGEQIPEEEVLRGLVKPEDVCLLEGMQVGQQHLHDSGYDKDEESGDDDEGKEGEGFEQQMAPWKTTRNFLLASQGKAMLHLHGEGDPTGRGEGFSFIKTSMKGGFRAVGESVEDKLDARRLKELGGHSYNVARQQKSYEESIRRIWEAQKNSLSSNVEHSGDEFDLDDHDNDGEREHRETSIDTLRPPRSERPTPSFTFGRRDDETASVFSRFSTSSQSAKIMKITRKIRNNRGEVESVVELVRDPRVIKQYQKQRHEAELRNLALNDIRPTGDPETDARRMRHIQEELQRLQRNKERRHAREKQKGISGGSIDLGSPASTVAGFPGLGALAATGAGPGKGGGTTRKCANCGMVGHIKTNKKMCPMLNGTMQRQQQAMQLLSESQSKAHTPVPETEAVDEFAERKQFEEHSQAGSNAGSPLSSYPPL
ncbi:hypothetical protein KEM54_000422 [Ascosphaera aggregata]|nr:hypothetical protein KEM54_000422 [Ascosphaera aggregata]